MLFELKIENNNKKREGLELKIYFLNKFRRSNVKGVYFERTTRNKLINRYKKREMKLYIENLVYNKVKDPVSRFEEMFLKENEEYWKNKNQTNR